MKKLNSFIMPLIIITGISLYCSDSRAPLDQELLAQNLARVHINLDLPGDVAKISFIDRVLRFFATEAVAQEAPSIESISIQVTGPGMAPVTATITGSASTIYVPAGVSRFFDVRASTDLATLRGTTVATLSAGSTANLALTMSFYESKIVIPDLGDNQELSFDIPRIVAMDSMNGSGWKENTHSFYGISDPNDFSPWDIEFDNRGRMIVANIHPPLAVLRFDNFATSSYDVLATDLGSYGAQALAYDHINDILYIGHDNWELWKYEDGTLSDVGISNHGNVRGVAVDLDGFPYTAHGSRITKSDPTDGSDIAFYDIGVLTEAWDVIVKNGFVYVAQYNHDIQSENKIIEFDTDLNPTGRELIGRPGGGDDFLGPHRFVAIYSRRFFVIDEHEADYTNADERIVAFDNISGAGWETFKASDIGENQFAFYHNC